MQNGGSRSREPLIAASGIWKIFGPKPDRILGTPDAELSRAELREKTGCVAAVREPRYLDARAGDEALELGEERRVERLLARRVRGHDSPRASVSAPGPKRKPE